MEDIIEELKEAVTTAAETAALQDHCVLNQELEQFTDKMAYLTSALQNQIIKLETTVRKGQIEFYLTVQNRMESSELYIWHKTTFGQSQ